MKGGVPVAEVKRAARLAELCKALSHPVRIEVMNLLLRENGGCYCGDLAEKFGLAQSTMSHHLKALRDAGFIVGKEEGAATCYCADRATVKELRTLLDWQ